MEEFARDWWVRRLASTSALITRPPGSRMARCTSVDGLTESREVIGAVTAWPDIRRPVKTSPR